MGRLSSPNCLVPNNRTLDTRQLRDSKPPAIVRRRPRCGSVRPFDLRGYIFIRFFLYAK